jgi:hypothetical protein
MQGKTEEEKQRSSHSMKKSNLKERLIVKGKVVPMLIKHHAVET